MQQTVRISFGNAMLMGAGFTLGAFLMTVLILIGIIMFLPIITDVIQEAFRDAMTGRP